MMSDHARNIVQAELTRMAINSGRYSRGAPQFEKLQYMRLVLQSLAAGMKYRSLQDALQASSAGFTRLRLNSAWDTVAGEIQMKYFQGEAANALLTGIDREECNQLVGFINERLRR